MPKNSFDKRSGTFWTRDSGQSWILEGVTQQDAYPRRWIENPERDKEFHLELNDIKEVSGRGITQSGRFCNA